MAVLQGGRAAKHRRPVSCRASETDGGVWTFVDESICKSLDYWCHPLLCHGIIYSFKHQYIKTLAFIEKKNKIQPRCDPTGHHAFHVVTVLQVIFHYLKNNTSSG
uniref:Uncharacterized protein n=1 Tax=Setaria viridis TaxID=4556 RepID=A0A4U6TJK3_SETVI|nr:hypothetical protein SEVIR_8G173000v2 [Setaria viridis]